MLFDRGKYTKVAEFNPLQWSSSHTYIALSTTFEATNSRRITDGGFPLRGQVSPHPRPSTVLASMKLYVLINAPHCLRGEGDIITLHPMNVEACRRRAMHSGCGFIVIIESSETFPGHSWTVQVYIRGERCSDRYSDHHHTPHTPISISK